MPNQIALDEISDESFTAYRWQIDSVYGSSEHRALLEYGRVLIKR